MSQGLIPLIGKWGEGVLESRHKGLENPGWWGMGKPSQVRRGLRVGEMWTGLGVASSNINHRSGEQVCWEGERKIKRDKR